MSSDRTILVAESDREVRTSTARALIDAGFRVLEAGDGPYALRQAFAQRPVAAVITLNLPLLNGLELVKVLRAASDMVLVVLAEGASKELAVRVLESGADDYLERPLHLPELVARLRSCLRRADARQAVPPPAEMGDRELVRTGPLTIDPEGHVVLKRGIEVPMTRIEYLLLGALCKRAGQIARHRYLLTEVWGAEYLDDTHYLRGYIASLRNKLEDDPAHPRLVLTEWGVGYRLATLPQEDSSSREASTPSFAAG